MEPYLEVERYDLVSALRQLKVGLRRHAGQEARLSFDGHVLEVALQGVTSGVPARGRWRGTARVTARALASLVRLPPRDEHLVLKYSNGVIRIGRILLSARWQDIGPGAIEVPLNATMLDYLAIRETRSPAEIVASGLEKELDVLGVKAEKIIQRAARVLATLEIGAQELRVLFSHNLRRRVAEDRDGTAEGRR